MCHSLPLTLLPSCVQLPMMKKHTERAGHASGRARRLWTTTRPRLRHRSARWQPLSRRRRRLTASSRLPKPGKLSTRRSWKSAKRNSLPSGLLLPLSSWSARRRTSKRTSRFTRECDVPSGNKRTGSWPASPNSTPSSNNWVRGMSELRVLVFLCLPLASSFVPMHTLLHSSVSCPCSSFVLALYKAIHTRAHEHTQTHACMYTHTHIFPLFFHLLSSLLFSHPSPPPHIPNSSSLLFDNSERREMETSFRTSTCSRHLDRQRESTVSCSAD